MTSWESIFQQSKVNGGQYFGDWLPTQPWKWPKKTWLRKRREYLQKQYEQEKKGNESP